MTRRSVSLCCSDTDWYVICKHSSAFPPVPRIRAPLLFRASRRTRRARRTWRTRRTLSAWIAQRLKVFLRPLVWPASLACDCIAIHREACVMVASPRLQSLFTRDWVSRTLYRASAFFDFFCKLRVYLNRLFIKTDPCHRAVERIFTPSIIDACVASFYVLFYVAE